MTELKRRNDRYTNPRIDENGKPCGQQVVFSVRVEPEISDLVKKWAKETGWTKRQIVETALEDLFNTISIERAKAMRAKAENLSIDEPPFFKSCRKDFNIGDADLVKHASDHHQMMTSSCEDDLNSTTDEIPVWDYAGIIGWWPLLKP